MPTIACGDDDPLPNEGQEHQTESLNTSKAKKRPYSAALTSSTTSHDNRVNFDDRFQALSARLGGGPVAGARPNSSNGGQQHQGHSMQSSVISALDILRKGTFHSSTLKDGGIRGRGGGDVGHEDETVIMSSLAEELLQQFQEIDQYHYSLEKEREAKQREEDMIKRRRELREQKELRKMMKEQLKNQQQQHSGATVVVENDDNADRQTTYSKFSSVNTTTSVSVALKRDDLYELPPSVVNNIGPMKRRYDGSVKATTGYRKMFSNNPNDHEEVHKSLLQKVPSSTLKMTTTPQVAATKRTSSASSSSNNVPDSSIPRDSTKTKNFPSDASVVSGVTTATRTSTSLLNLRKPSAMTFSSNPYNPTNRQAERFEKLKKEQQALIKEEQQRKILNNSNNKNRNNSSAIPVSGRYQDQNQQRNSADVHVIGDDEDDSNDDDDEDREDEEDDENVNPLLEDEGAIKFCCFKICTRIKRTGKFECTVCRKVFSGMNDDGNNINRKVDSCITTEEEAEEQDVAGLVRNGNNNIDDDATVIIRQGRNNVQNANDDDQTGELEQQLLFQLAVLQWRGVAVAAPPPKSNDGDIHDTNSSYFDADAELARERKCPDISKFVYFSRLWENLETLDEDDF